MLKHWELERSELLKSVATLSNGDVDETTVPGLSGRLLAFNRQWFAKYEEVLHKGSSGPTWLSRADCSGGR